jgi:hypothetical protein
MKAGVDYPDTERLKVARIALLVADADDPEIEEYRIEHRAAFAEALAMGKVHDA